MQQQFSSFFFLRCVVMGRPDCSMRLDVRRARALLAESNSQFVLNPTGQFRSDGQRIAGSACDYQFISQGGSAATNPGVQQRRGKFYSPLYPSLYPPRSRCFYHFYGRNIYTEAPLLAQMFPPNRFACASNKISRRAKPPVSRATTTPRGK